MLKAKKAEIILILVSLIFSILFFKYQIANLFKTDFAKGYYYSRQFDLPARWINTDNLSKIEAKSREDSGGMSYKFLKEKNGRVYVKFLFGKPYDAISEKYKYLRSASVFTDNKKVREFNYANLNIGETTAEITKSLDGLTDFALDLESIANDRNKHNELAIRRVEVSVLPSGKDFLPNLPLIFMATVTPLILFYCFQAYGLSVFVSCICSFASLVIFYLFTNFYYDFMAGSHIFILLGISLFYSSMVIAKKMKVHHIHLVLIAILLLVAIHLRWSEVERVAFAIPHPDAYHPNGLGYRQLADNMKLFSAEDGFFAAKTIHEPLYPLIAKTFFGIFGSSDLHLKFVSFVFSVLSVILTYLVAQEIFKNRSIALIALAIITVNRFLIEQASFGLRLELEMCLLLILFYFCYLKKEAFRDWIWVILSGAIGGLILLTKSSYIPVILFIFAYSALSRKGYKLIKRMLLFIAVSIFSVLFFLPYKINLYKDRGNISAFSNEYATTFANFEFAGHPGFPRDNVTLSEYYFKLHTPVQFVAYHLIGTAGIFYFFSEEIFNVINEQNHLLKIFLEDKFRGLIRYPLLTFKIILTLFITVSAFIFCLINRNSRLIVYIIILGCFANLFLYGVNIAKGVIVMQAHRTIAQALPFVAFCIAYILYKMYAILIGTQILRKNRQTYR